jgi:predicted nucleic acid-binding protein
MLGPVRHLSRPPGPVIMTEYVARHELSQLAREVAALEAAGALRIEPLEAKNADFRRLRQSGADKGEAEAIAWALAQNPRPCFVSVDKGARRLARENRVVAGDIMDLLTDLIGLGLLSLEEARSHAEPWNDRRQQRGRPADFTTFDEMFTRRRRNRWIG